MQTWFVRAKLNNKSLYYSCTTVRNFPHLARIDSFSDATSCQTTCLEQDVLRQVKPLVVWSCIHMFVSVFQWCLLLWLYSSQSIKTFDFCTICVTWYKIFRDNWLQHVCQNGREPNRTWIWIWISVRIHLLYITAPFTRVERLLCMANALIFAKYCTVPVNWETTDVQLWYFVIWIDVISSNMDKRVKYSDFTK